MNSFEKLYRPLTLEQRLEIKVRAENGANDTEIATAMNLSKSVVRKWRRRYRDRGSDGLVSLLGRSKSGALSQFSQEMRDAIKIWRKSHSGWGAGTLRVELARDKRFEGLPLPSRSRISAFLKSEGLVRPYERHTKLSMPAPKIVTECHEEWELDAQGACRVAGVGLVSLLNFGDLYSHVRVTWACLNRRKAAGSDYQLALRRGFFCFGMPQRISLDHDSAFFDNTTPSPFPSQFHLWLLALGIGVRFLEHRPPREHSFIERSHQIVYRQAIEGQSFAPTDLQPYIEQRLEFLNQYYPSRSLHQQPPLTAYPQAAHSGREYRPEWEAELLDMQKVFAYLAQQTWYRQVSAQGQLMLGTQRYGLGKAWQKDPVRITFDQATQEFICDTLDLQKTVRFQARGMTKQDLMGELNMTAFANHQYAFPWSILSLRQNQTADLIGTTL
jgi:transposase